MVTEAEVVEEILRNYSKGKVIIICYCIPNKRYVLIGKVTDSRIEGIAKTILKGGYRELILNSPIMISRESGKEENRIQGIVPDDKIELPEITELEIAKGAIRAGTPFKKGLLWVSEFSFRFLTWVVSYISD